MISPFWNTQLLSLSYNLRFKYFTFVCLSFLLGPENTYVLGNWCSIFNFFTKTQNTKLTFGIKKKNIRVIFRNIRSFLRIWSHLLKNSLSENLIFCAVQVKIMINTFSDPVHPKGHLYQISSHLTICCKFDNCLGIVSKFHS